MEIAPLHKTTARRSRRPRPAGPAAGPQDTVQFLQQMDRRQSLSLHQAPVLAPNMSGKLLRWMQVELAQATPQPDALYEKAELAVLVNALQQLHHKNLDRRWQELA